VVVSLDNNSCNDIYELGATIEVCHTDKSWEAGNCGFESTFLHIKYPCNLLPYELFFEDGIWAILTGPILLHSFFFFFGTILLHSIIT